MGCGAIASALVGLFFNRTAFLMAAIMCGCSLLGLTILLIGRRTITYQANDEDVKAQSYELIEKY